MRLWTTCLVAFLELMASGQSVSTDNTHGGTTGPLAVPHESSLVLLDSRSLQPRFLGIQLMFADLVAAAIVVPSLYLAFGVYLPRAFESFLDNLERRPDRESWRLLVMLGFFRWEFGCFIHPIEKEFVKDYFRKRLRNARRGWFPLVGTEWWGTLASGSRECYVNVRIVGLRPPKRKTLG
ncbi:hypothetical protein XANCAGTX0491_009261 [Xanthoria calcicola]